MTPTALISRSQLEERLGELDARTPDPRAGIFGPDTKVWEVNRATVVFLGAGRAALLQLAHPFVAHAIDQHSRTRDDPFGRFQRTFAQVFAMVFGDLPAAFRASRAVHAVHERISGVVPAAACAVGAGTPYHANAPQALLWVHATLWDTSILAYETVIRRLSDAEKERYYEETKRFAALFGIPDAILPPDWTSFRRYVAGMLDGPELAVTAPAARMAGFLLRPPHPLLAPLADRYALLTAWWLPERLADGFGLDRGGSRGQTRVEKTIDWLRAVYPRLPRRLRHLPAYVEARRRIAGRRGPDPLGRLLGRALVGPAHGG